MYNINENGNLLNTYKLSAKLTSGPESINVHTSSNVNTPLNLSSIASLSKDTVAVTFSANGEYIYSAREDNHVYIFNSTSKAQVGSFLVSNSETIDIVHSPKSNILATLSTDGLLRLWKS